MHDWSFFDIQTQSQIILILILILIELLEMLLFRTEASLTTETLYYYCWILQPRLVHK